MLPLVSVVIPNWNGKKYLRDCIASLQQKWDRSSVQEK